MSSQQQSLSFPSTIFSSHQLPREHYCLFIAAINQVRYEMCAANSRFNQRHIGHATLSKHLEAVRSEKSFKQGLLRAKKLGIGNCGEFANRLWLYLAAYLPEGCTICKVVHKSPGEDDNHAFIIVKIPSVGVFDVDAWDKRIERYNSNYKTYKLEHTKIVDGTETIIDSNLQKKARILDKEIRETACVAMDVSALQLDISESAYADPDPQLIYIGKGVLNQNSHILFLSDTNTRGEPQSHTCDATLAPQSPVSMEM